MKIENSCPTDVIQAGTIENEGEWVNVRMSKCANVQMGEIEN
ncbi:hypothetical protein QTN47_12870 [Danxiaibacter flavus]|uniref:Uncharacterized protein n=1 Tax=Danxiaibacter flavus TaxID=3049108 RepID=A0ABV3ZIQ4_9BACT|nr:hypothetical protein QNM32_12875 [Chitinophagaceae bacterium DXS]